MLKIWFIIRLKLGYEHTIFVFCIPYHFFSHNISRVFKTIETTFL